MLPYCSGVRWLWSSFRQSVSVSAQKHTGIYFSEPGRSNSHRSAGSLLGFVSASRANQRSVPNSTSSKTSK